MVDFLIRGYAGVMAELRDVVRKKNGGRSASSRGFVRKISFSVFFFVGDATQVLKVREEPPSIFVDTPSMVRLSQD